MTGRTGVGAGGDEAGGGRKGRPCGRFGFVEKFVLFAAAHVLMVLLLIRLLGRYAPEAGFQLGSLGTAGWFALLTIAPLVVGMATVHRWATLLVVVLHVTSPPWLLGAMRDPSEDLNFAVLLWWVPLPAAATVIVAADALLGWWRTRRSAVRRVDRLSRPGDVGSRPWQHTSTS